MSGLALARIKSTLDTLSPKERKDLRDDLVARVAEDERKTALRSEALAQLEPGKAGQ